MRLHLPELFTCLLSLLLPSARPPRPLGQFPLAPKSAAFFRHPTRPTSSRHPSPVLFHNVEPIFFGLGIIWNGA